MPHKHFTLKQQIKWQRHIIKHDKWVIRTRLLHTAASVLFARKQLLWTQSELRQSLERLSYSALLSGSVLPTSSFPPHHDLWDCIGKYEGSPTSVNPNGHYGKLQMHYNWGYGIVGPATNYTEEQQEWAAERGYAANKYSITFLDNQWFNYDNAKPTCIKYA